MTNAGGLGILCADTCEAQRPAGRARCRMGPRSELRSFLAAEASVSNPVDMIASATAEDYGRAIATVAADPDVDAMIVIYIPPQADKAAEIGHAIVDAIEEVDGRIPIATTWVCRRRTSRRTCARPARGSRPSPSPKPAAIAMAHACRYGGWRERPEGTVPTYRRYAIPTRSRPSLAEALGQRRGVAQRREQVERVLSAASLPVVRSHHAGTPEEAGEAAAVIGRAGRPEGAGAGHRAQDRARRRPDRPDRVPAPVRRRPTRWPGPSRLRGSATTGSSCRRWSSLASRCSWAWRTIRRSDRWSRASAGGTQVELLRDVAVRVTPITDLDATEMVRSLRDLPAARGLPRRAEGRRRRPRGRDPSRRGASWTAHPAIAEMDCNPVIVLPRGAAIVDARIRVQEVARPETARRTRVARVALRGERRAPSTAHVRRSARSRCPGARGAPLAPPGDRRPADRLPSRRAAATSACSGRPMAMSRMGTSPRSVGRSNAPVRARAGSPPPPRASTRCRDPGRPGPRAAGGARRRSRPRSRRRARPSTPRRRSRRRRR